MNITKATIKIYDKIAEKYAASFNKNKINSIEKEVILAFINSLPYGAKILDVGCGNCDYYFLFCEKNLDYTGIDLSKEMIKIAKRDNPTGKLIVKDMRKLDFPENSYDGIFCFFSLIHIQKNEVNSVMKKLSNILKHNGKILIAIQEGENEVFVDTTFLPGKKIFLDLFSEQEIKILLEHNRFKIVTLRKRLSESKNELPYNKMYILASNQKNRI